MLLERILDMSMDFPEISKKFVEMSRKFAEFATKFVEISKIILNISTIFQLPCSPTGLQLCGPDRGERSGKAMLCPLLSVSST